MFNRTNPVIESRATMIYESLPYDGPGYKPCWSPNGNSEMQDECRRQAINELDEEGVDLTPERKTYPIPIMAAEQIAKGYGYDQVIILGRRVGEDGVDHLTTYGINPTHCKVAGNIGDTFKRWMGWINPLGNGPEGKP